ncbi:MAG TPA: DUF6683 family protein [Sphingomonas sp.]|nr:DUF6683 family protein [Sphingomonas sp.]
MPWRNCVCPAALAALLMAASAGSVAAQDVGGVLDMTGMGIYAMEDAVMEAAQESVSGRRATSPVTAKLTRYAPSAERRRANLARFVEKTRTRDPAGAARLQSLFASSDVIGAMGKQMAPYGLRTDDAADAYAVWWMNAWLASRGRNDTPSQGQITAVKAQAARALASAPGFAAASDAAKQELAEAHLVQAALIESYVSGARGDSKLLRKIADAVRQGARRSGLDLDTMELTPTGFVPR